MDGGRDGGVECRVLKCAVRKDQVKVKEVVVMEWLRGVKFCKMKRM